MDRYQTPYTTLNEIAAAARTGVPKDLHRLTNYVIDTYSPFRFPESHSFRDRVYRAELAFRAGNHPSIREADVVAAFNDAVGIFDEIAPAWARTSMEQFHLFRVMLKPQIPQLVGLRPSGKGMFGISDEMSPVEAILLSLHLTYGKLESPEFQIPADEWVKAVRSAKPKIGTDVTSAEPSVGARIVDTGIAALRNTVSAGLTAETTKISQEVNEFLDRARVRR